MSDLLTRPVRHLHVVPNPTESHPVWCNDMSLCGDHHMSEPTPVAATAGGFRVGDNECASFPLVETYAKLDAGTPKVTITVRSPLVKGPANWLDVDLTPDTAQAFTTAVYNAIFGVQTSWQATGQTYGGPTIIGMAPTGDGNVRLVLTRAAAQIPVTLRPSEARELADAVSAKVAVLDAPLAWVDVEIPQVLR
jgi:hypothetical protein